MANSKTADFDSVHVNEESVGGAGIRDLATDQDDLGFSVYVKALAAFLTHRDTKPPLTISVEGPWGVGKSSFMRLLEKEISQHTSDGRPRKTVWFSAWRLDKEEAVWASFALSVTQALADSLRWRKRLMADLRLQLRRFDWHKGWFEVAKFIFLTAFLVYMLVGIVIYFRAHHSELERFSWSPRSAANAVQPFEDRLLDLLFASLGAGGTLLLGAFLVNKATGAIGNPFRIDLKQFSEGLKYEERVSFIQRFHKDFREIVQTYAEHQTVFVFIDDLDRSEVPRAAELMQSINLLLSDTAQVVYVLGLDREKIAAGLASKFHEVLPYLNERRDRSNESVGLDFGYSYLEKFIQIPFPVPRPADRDISRFLRRLNNQQSDSNKQEPAEIPSTILFETRTDSPLVQGIVMKMAPALEHNPRRIKQFINLFRLNAIIASQTGLFGPPRSKEYAEFTPQILGKLLVIYLRWPLLFSDAWSTPRLLQLLELEALNQVSSEPGGPTTRERELLGSWMTKPLRDLLRVGLRNNKNLDEIDESWSLDRLDLERYLQVAPAVLVRREADGSVRPSREETARERQTRGREADRERKRSNIRK